MNYKTRKNASKLSSNLLVATMMILFTIFSSKLLSQEDCLSLDPHSIELKRLNGKWFINSASVDRTLMTTTEFSTARKVKDIIEYYGFTQSCYIGRPDPDFQYWLVNYAAPRGSYKSETCRSIAVDKLDIIRARSESRIWTITDGQSLMFTFNSRLDAEKALRIIKEYGFTFTCRVLRTDFSYLRK